MSTFIMSSCWPLQDMTSTQKAVLISLADQANDDGVCWPSIAKISMRTCLSERAVQGAIKWLVGAGILVVNERDGRSTLYQITPAAYAPPQHMRGAAGALTPADGALTPAAYAPAPAAAAPITIIKHKEPSGNRKNSGVELLPLVLPDWLPKNVWGDWVAHRKSVKAPLTYRAAELCISKLSSLRDLGNDPEAVINQSVISGKWTDLYPLKAGSTQAPQGGKQLNRQEALEAKNREAVAAYLGARA